MTWQFISKNIHSVHPVPPSPQLEQKILKTKQRFLTGESLPKKTTLDILDLQSFVLIAQRPAYTRPHTLSAPSPVSTSSPVIGERRALVLLVDFQDNPSSKLRQHYIDMLFSSGKYPTGSLRDYYYEASYHKLTITGDVSGGDSKGEGSDKGWYRAPKACSYYADQKYGFGEYPKNATRLVEDAVDLAAGHVDFANYDVDGDGEVDALFIVHAGLGAEVSGLTSHIWSHISNIPPKTVDGVRVSRYSMEPEDGNSGVFCHELGHVFGLPDLYDYDMDSAGTGSWDLMAGGSWNNGGLTPAHPVGWCKVRLGWVKPQLVSGSLESIILKPSIQYQETYRMPAGGNEKEYFLIENRKRTGFDSYIPGEGLMVQHVDENQRNNNDQGHYLVDIEQCDGRCDLNKNANRGDGEDLFPTKDNNSFSAKTKPSSKTYSGEDSRVELKNIRRSGENIIIDLSIDDGSTGEVPEAIWHYEQRITMAFAHSSQWAWAHISGLGWRRIKEKAVDVFSLCGQAIAGGHKAHVYADDSFIYEINLNAV
jgi:immune inhibitor A